MQPSARAVAGIIVRRSWLAWSALIVLVTQIAVLCMRGAPWRGDLIWTIDWFAIGHIIVGPVIAGCVAVDASRFAAGMRALPVRGLRSPVNTVVGIYAATMVTVHLIVMLGALAWSRPPAFAVVALLAIGAQVFMVVAFVAVGAVVGRFASPFIAGAAAAIIAGFAVVSFSSSGSALPLLLAGGATVPRVGYRYDVGWLVLQCLALAFVIVSLMLVGPAKSRLRQVAFASIACVGVVAALFTVSRAPDERLEAVSVEPTSCGALATVPWCYFPEHERVIDGYASNLLALFDAAQEGGYEPLVPASIVEASQRNWPGDATTGAFYVTAQALGGERVSLWEVTAGLVEPIHCSQLQQDDPPGEKYWQDLDDLMFTWMALVDPAEAETASGTMRMLSPDEAAQLIGEFRTCTYPF